MKKLIITLALLVLISVIGYLAWVKFLSPQKASIVPTEEIKYLLASDFPDLPKSIAEVLQRRGCAIRQYIYNEETDNVIAGEFAEKGQKDWAVLCTQNPTSLNPTFTIMVFWKGSPDNISEIPSYGDFINVASEERIRLFSYEYNYETGEDDYYDPPIPFDSWHAGIEDSIGEKASTIYFYLNGKWLDLSGSD